MFKKIIKYTWLVILHGLFYIITYMCPKDKKLWVFGCWEGKIYADNAKYLYEWVIENRKDVKAVWLTRNHDICELLNNKNYTSYCAGTWKAFITLARAIVIIETEGNSDVGGYRPGRCKVIQLWHGVAPKKMKWARHYNRIQTIGRNIVFDNHANSYWMLSSERNKEDFQKFFKISKDHTFVTGYSRNDALLNFNEKSEVIQSLDKQYPGCKKIIYMPTHRNFGLDTDCLPISKMSIINDFLVEHNYVMVFKPHFHELKKYLDIESELTNMVLAKNQTLYGDVYSYIGQFDLLICDYSSIIYDFLCTKKPIILFTYDIKQYKENVGLFECFERIPCGPMCASWEEVLEQCERLFMNDTWGENREINRKLFHPFEDGKNSERIYDVINDLINGC